MEARLLPSAGWLAGWPPACKLQVIPMQGRKVYSWEQEGGILRRVPRAALRGLTTRSYVFFFFSFGPSQPGLSERQCDWSRGPVPAQISCPAPGGSHGTTGPTAGQPAFFHLRYLAWAAVTIPRPVSCSLLVSLLDRKTWPAGGMDGWTDGRMGWNTWI